MARHPSATINRVQAFSATVVPRLPSVEPQNVLRLSLHLWIRCCQFLEIILERHDRVVQEYRAIETRSSLFIKEFQEQQRQATPQETEDLVLQQRLMPYLHLEIESFYLFAKILLDRIADTCGYCFGVRLHRAGSTFSQLHSKATRGDVRPPLPSLLVEQMDELRRKVTDYRSELIEHGGEPRLTRATVIRDDGVPRIYPMMRSPRPGEVETYQRETDDPHHLVELLDAHVGAWLDFFETHLSEARFGTADQ
jgi:hypothetical protein